MGVVFRARAPGGREVALKLLAGRGPITDAQRARFLREGELTARLQHPGILRVHAAGLDGDRPFLVYELVTGATTLDDVLRTQPRERVLELIEATARALGYAHAQGVIHRDVKPSNVLLDRSGAVKVADFGLALAPGLDRLTQTGAVVGTPSYMAPEQLLGERERQGPPTDVWALGVLLYKALTGTLPFDGDTLLALGARISMGLERGPREHDPSVSRALDAVCRQALQPDPAQRYPDATAFADALAGACRGEAPPGLGQPRARVAGAVALVLAIVLAALGAALATSRGPSPTDPTPPTPEARAGTEVPTPKESAAPAPAPLRAGRLLTLSASEGAAAGIRFVGRRRFLLWSDDTLRLLELSEQIERAREVRSWKLPGPVGDVVPAPGTGFLLTAGDAVHALALDAEATPVLYRGTARLGRLAASPDGRWLAVADARALHLIERATDEVRGRWGLPGSPDHFQQVEFVDDDSLLWLVHGPDDDPMDNALLHYQLSRPDDPPRSSGLFGSARAFQRLPRAEQVVVAAGLFVLLLGPPPELAPRGELEGPTGAAEGELALPTQALWASPDERRVLGLAASRSQPPRSALRCWDPVAATAVGPGLELPGQYWPGLAVSPDEALVVLYGPRGLEAWNAEPLLARD